MRPRSRSWLAAALGLGLLSASSCRSAGSFAPNLPPELPDIRGWERSSGSAAFQNPSSLMEYEVYVNPSRPGVYSLTRYRVTLGERPERGAPVSPEKLQWDRDGRDVRRYECAPKGGDARGCDWHELRRGSPEYDREMPTILSVYSLHAALLRRRESRN